VKASEATQRICVGAFANRGKKHWEKKKGTKVPRSNRATHLYHEHKRQQSSPTHWGPSVGGEALCLGQIIGEEKSHSGGFPGGWRGVFNPVSKMGKRNTTDGTHLGNRMRESLERPQVWGCLIKRMGKNRSVTKE